MSRLRSLRPADRLPAEQLDRAVLQALLDTFQRTDLFEQAVAASRTQAEALRDQHQAELSAVTTEIARAEAAIERYLDAFEAGSLPEDQCGQRVQRLGGKIAELRIALAAVHLQPPSRPAAKTWSTWPSRSAWQCRPGRCPPARRSSTPLSRRSRSSAVTASSRCSACPQRRPQCQAAGFGQWVNRCAARDSNPEPAD